MQANNFRAGLWRLADPKISLASFAGLFLAGCFAAADVGLHWGWFVLTVLGVFCVEVGKNASGEVIDYDSGTDLAISEAERSPFSGGKRVMVDGLLSRREVWGIAAAFFGAAILIGVVIVAFRDVRVLAFGVLGVALAWYYHGGALRLSYRGLGELAVALAYGPLVVLGAYFVQAGFLSPTLVHLSLVLGLLVAAFLWVNEFPDYRADAAAGKRNLVVVLGPERAAAAYTTLVAVAYGYLALLMWSDESARACWPAFLGLIPSLFSIVRVQSAHSDIPRLVPAQAAALLSFILMAVGAGAGYLFVS